MDSAQAYVSLERNMKCAIGHCGHCQLGPEFICRDGPVFRHERVAPLLRVPGL
jgi:NAD(P)H-flavin reductase